MTVVAVCCYGLCFVLLFMDVHKMNLGKRLSRVRVYAPFSFVKLNLLEMIFLAIRLCALFFVYILERVFAHVYHDVVDRMNTMARNVINKIYFNPDGFFFFFKMAQKLTEIYFVFFPFLCTQCAHTIDRSSSSNLSLFHQPNGLVDLSVFTGIR